MRAHAAAVSTAGLGAAAKTIRMHNEPVEPTAAHPPPLGLSLYKDRRHSKGGSSSSVSECLPLQHRVRAFLCGLFLQAGGRRAGAVMCS